MTVLSVASVVLAMRLWDGFGWAAQAVFTWRMLHQWVASEREGRTVLPRSFWSWSMLGSALDITYLAYRRDPVFLSGALINACIFARNWWMARRSRQGTPSPSARRLRLWLPVFAGLLLFAFVVVEAIGPDHGAVHFERRPFWLVVGFLGTLGWSARFVVQWWASERRAVSHLPPAFFYVGLSAAGFLFAYAISQVDWVKTVAFGLTLIPYGRNALILRRHRAAAAGVAASPPAPVAGGEPPS